MTNYRDPNQVRMDALWREYVMSDPDLRKIELEKRRAARRRAKKAHAFRVRMEALHAIKESLLIFTFGVVMTVAILVFVIIFFYLA